MIKIAPSILSADFANLERDIQRISTADYVHVDVMDGMFVPNITIGIPVVKSIRPTTALPLDVHLMIVEPGRYVEQFCDAGADLVTVHVESDTEEKLHDAIARIHAKGKRAGVVLKPKTPAETVLPFLNEVELVLVMTVEPGFGGQKFMADMMPKVSAIRRWIDEKNPGCELEVDGGVDRPPVPGPGGHEDPDRPPGGRHGGGGPAGGGGAAAGKRPAPGGHGSPGHRIQGVPGGSGRHRHGGGGRGGGEAPLPAIRQAPADLAAAKSGHSLDLVGKRPGFCPGPPGFDGNPGRRWRILAVSGRETGKSSDSYRKKERTYMQTKANLQDLFLLRARRDKLPVTMFLMNGFQMRGTIAGFDAFVVVLDSDGRQQIIYKHAISTIAPVRPVDLEGEEPAVAGA